MLSFVNVIEEDHELLPLLFNLLFTEGLVPVMRYLFFSAFTFDLMKKFFVQELDYFIWCGDLDSLRHRCIWFEDASIEFLSLLVNTKFELYLLINFVRLAAGVVNCALAHIVAKLAFDACIVFIRILDESSAFLLWLKERRSPPYSRVIFDYLCLAL